MVEQLLVARGDRNSFDKYNSLLFSSVFNVSTGLNWVHKFMARHKHLVSKFVPPLNKDRAMAQSPAILKK